MAKRKENEEKSFKGWDEDKGVYKKTFLIDGEKFDFEAKEITAQGKKAGAKSAFTHEMGYGGGSGSTVKDVITEVENVMNMAEEMGGYKKDANMARSLFQASADWRKEGLELETKNSLFEYSQLKKSYMDEEKRNWEPKSISGPLACYGYELQDGGFSKSAGGKIADLSARLAGKRPEVWQKLCSVRGRYSLEKIGFNSHAEKAQWEREGAFMGKRAQLPLVERWDFKRNFSGLEAQAFVMQFRSWQKNNERALENSERIKYMAETGKGNVSGWAGNEYKYAAHEKGIVVTRLKDGQKAEISKKEAPAFEKSFGEMAARAGNGAQMKNKVKYLDGYLKHMFEAVNEEKKRSRKPEELTRQKVSKRGR